VERLSGAPLAHLTGFQMFMGLQFHCNRDALVPRRETEIVARAGLAKLQQQAATQDRVRFIDLCTGSGNLAVSLAAREPRSYFVAADLCPKAVALAQKNAARMGVADRATFRQGDLFDALTEEDRKPAADLIICNPPYISSGKVKKLPTETLNNEPHLAFDGGPFGLNILTRLINTAPAFLKPGGWLCFEAGLGQGPFIIRSLKRIPDYITIEQFNDSEGQVRALAAQVK
jgi:release factor glutamine methyltransferase